MGTFRLHSGDDEWHDRMAREQEEANRIYNLPEQKAARKFRAALHKLYKRHGLSLSHQDGQGAFIITNQRMDRNKTALDCAEVDIRANPKESDPGFDPNFNPNPAELNHDHDFLYKDN